MGHLMVILLVPLLALLAAGHDISPLVCMTEPTIKLVAGQSNVSALVENPFGRRCEAVLRFIDAAAEPITYGFDANPCLGVQVATFQIPLGVPNGYTYLIWQCGRQLPTCNQVLISGGEGDTALDSQQNGTVTCSTPSIWNETTLSTVVSTSGTASTATTTRAQAQDTHLSATLPTFQNSSTGDLTSRSTSTTTSASSLNTDDGFTQVSTASRTSSSIAFALTVLTITITVTTMVSGAPATPAGSP